MIISDIGDFIEKIDNKELSEKDYEDLRHTLLCARKSIMDYKKENDLISDRSEVSESNLKKEKFYNHQLKDQVRNLKDKK